MIYTKQNFSDGSVLSAAQLNHMEDAIAELATLITNATSSSAKMREITLLASEWESDEYIHSQVVNIAGVTENSKVDLTPDVLQLAIFYEKDLTFVTENDNGVVTVYAIGQKPANDYTIKVTITEVGA